MNQLDLQFDSQYERAEPFTLYKLNNLIKESLKTSFSSTYWVVAEISECKYHNSGHCYLELIQKQQNTDNIIARMRATIWSRTWGILRPKFENETGFPMAKGHQVLVEVSVLFHEIYGLSLTVVNIDPAYTLGNMQLRRAEIVRKLKADGVYDMNKALEMPVVLQKIAIVSSPQAAGYGDFMNQLHNNEYGLRFYTLLFPAIMQGEQSSVSVMNALNKIVDSGINFDAVIIIRGGGAVADLLSFDDYNLCFYCAQYPYPVITGLGHERDVSILDEVANTALKTPTAAAEFVIDRNAGILMFMENKAGDLVSVVKEIINESKINIETTALNLKKIALQSVTENGYKLDLIQSKFAGRIKTVIGSNTEKLDYFSKRLFDKTQNIIKENGARLDYAEKNINAYSPEKILKRGFSITLFNGKSLRSSDEINEGDIIETYLSTGKIKSKVQEKK